MDQSAAGAFFAIVVGLYCSSLSSPASGQILMRETFSRETSIFVGVDHEPTHPEAYSREISIFVGIDDSPQYAHAISREVSLMVATATAPEAIAALDVEMSPDGSVAVLSWMPYPELHQRDVVRYDIYVSDSLFTNVVGMTPYTSVSAGALSAVLAGLPAWQDRFYAVVPVDSSGRFEEYVEYSGGYVLAPETYSRELSVFVGIDPGPEYLSASSREVSVMVATGTAPEAITGLDVDMSPDGTVAVLSWAHYPELHQRDVVRYDIYLSPSLFTNVSGMTPYTSVPAGTLSAALAGLPAWQDRFYAVVPVDSSGRFDEEVEYSGGYVLAPETYSRELSVYVGVDSAPVYLSASSREVSVMVATAHVPEPVTYPGSAFSVQSAVMYPGAVDLDWTHYPEVHQQDVVRYRIYLQFSFFDSVSEMTPVAFVPAGTKQFTLKGLHGYGVYHFAVVAEDALGQFDPSVFSRSAIASGRVYSPQDYFSDYDIGLALDYRLEEELLNVRLWAWDRALGGRVSDGFSTYQVTQQGQVLATGSLYYSPSQGEWRAQQSFLAQPGRMDVQVLINGRSSARWLVVPSPFPVYLTGRAERDDGTPVAGAQVDLHRAEAVFAAEDLTELPEPLATFVTLEDGSFDFGGVDVGQYILTLQTEIGLTIGEAFWLRSGAAQEYRTLIDNPGRTTLLAEFARLRDQIRRSILESQTELMLDVTSTVDADLDGSKDLADWILLAGNLVSGTASEFASELAAGASADVLPQVVLSVTAESVAEEIVTEVAIELSLEVKRSIEAQAIAGRSAIFEPYFAYGGEQNEDTLAFYGGLAADHHYILDPTMSGDIPLPSFSRDNPVHRIALQNWFPLSSSYQFAETRLDRFYQELLADLPSLPSHFSVERMRLILAAAERQLEDIEVGSSSLFTSPWTNEVTGAEEWGVEPLGLNLWDYYTKYANGRAMAGVADLVSKGSGVLSIGLNTATAVSAGSVVGVPVAKATGVASLLVQGVGVGASFWRAGIQHDLAGTYAGMGMRYCVNLGMAPLALKRTADYALAEASGSLYYLDDRKSFDGEIRSVSLGGSSVLGHDVFYPVQLTLLPFTPPIQFTSVINAEIEIANLEGMDAADFRLDTRVRNWHGTYDHVVTPAGELEGGDTAVVQTPFRGHLRANSMMSPGVFEARLWTGPFQTARPVAAPFWVVPLNLGAPPGVAFLPAADETHAIAAMREPLSFVQSESQAMTAGELLAGAERVRDRVELNLRRGSHTFEKEYEFGADVFSAQFRLYRPLGASARMRIEVDGDSIFWNEATGSAHIGLPGEHSGGKGDPEVITVHNVAGRSVNVVVSLANLAGGGGNLLLEVWEQPMRSAVMTVLPDSVDSISQPEGVHVVELAIGESSHQHPLESVMVTASILRGPDGAQVPWQNISWEESTNIQAGGLRTCLFEISTQGVADGTYTGTVTVATPSAGTVMVPVSLTVDGEAPTVTILPVREWWYRSTGPVVTWVGQDNLTAEEDLVYSEWLAPVQESWSAYLPVTSLDMTDLPDGEYVLSIVAQDQALNVTDPAESVLIRIDRDGDLFRQRIVDADEQISDISEVDWDDDWDGDGASNWMEFLAGTDPTNPDDLFAFDEFSVEPDGFVIRWQAKRGISYQIYRTTDLLHEDWTEAPSGVGQDEKSLVTAKTDGEMVYRDPTLTSGPVFYKVEIVD